MCKHNWKIIKESSVFFTNIRTYKCVICRRKKYTYQPWGFKKETELCAPKQKLEK